MTSIRSLKIVLVFLAVFSLGWLLNTTITNFVYYDAEQPFSFSFTPFMPSPERNSPSDHVREEQIHVYDKQIVIELEGASWASFTDTNSMDPFFDSESNSIEIKPESENEIKEGDIISYYSKASGELIVHRVVSKGIDNKGIYYIVQGDNNPTQDPEKVRFGQVHGILVGIIY